MAAGAYSSIFIATPLVVQLKEREPGIKSGDARTLRHRSRKPVDRYASVPTFSEDMPIHDEPGAGDGDARPQDEPDEETVHAAAPARTPRFTAGERAPSRPVSPE